MSINRNWGSKNKFLLITAAAFFLLLSSCTFDQYTFNTLVWSDEFNGSEGSSPSTANWIYDIGTGSDKGLVDWGNNELQYYTSRTENARIVDFAKEGLGESGRGLVIEAKYEDYAARKYTSARLLTQGKHSWTYGRIEARIRLPKGQGLWPAFWMLGDNITSVGWPASGEIDIMEYKGNEPTKVHGTIHYGTPHEYSGNYYTHGKSFNTGFNTFSIEWKAGEIRWYVNNVLYSVKNKWKSSLSGTHAPFDRPFFILINMAVGGNFLPDPPANPDYFPQKMYIDYIRVYQ